jgi:spore coat protein A
MIRLSRRELLGLGLGGAGAVALGIAVGPPGGTLVTGRVLRSQLPLPQPFTVPLPVPRVAASVQVFGTDSYDLTIRQAVQEILPGVPTQVWGYNGEFPGCRARRSTAPRSPG